MFGQFFSVSRHCLRSNLMANSNIHKRLIFTQFLHITKPLTPSVGNIAPNPYKSLIVDLIDKYDKNLMNLGLRQETEDSLLQLDSVLRKRRQKIRNHKMTKRRKDYRISINHKNDVKKQKRLNRESRENYELEHGLKFYKH